jgi:hypothetical protein
VAQGGGRGELRGQDEVGLLFASVGVVQENRSALPEGGDGGLDGLHREATIRRHIKNELREKNG